MSYSLLGIIILVLDIIALLSIIQSGMTLGMKIVWALVVLFLPVIGMILWFLIGNKRVIA